MMNSSCVLKKINRVLDNHLLNVLGVKNNDETTTKTAEKSSST